MRDELGGYESIEKNVEPSQEMEFSTPISDVIDTPQMLIGEPSEPVMKKSSSSSKYPLNLKKDQVEALIAGVAGILGYSDFIQSKLIDTFPQFISDSGKLSATGSAVTVLIIAVIFYFLRKFIMNR